MQPDVAIVAQPSCIDALFGRVEAWVAPGASIADMVALTLPKAHSALRDRLRVTIGDHVILPGLWHSVRPKAGAQVLIRAVPGNDVLRNVLTIAVTVGALALGQFYAPTLAGSLLGLTGAATGSLTTVLSAAITGSTLLAGTLLINALIPTRSDKKDAPTYAIQGIQNQLTPDGVIPLILGFVRYAPPYAARPYTQAVGDDRFVVAAFCCGYGVVAMRNWRIGQTPIERYVNVNLEVRAGFGDDARLTLYPQQVIEEPLSIALQTSVVATGGPQIRTTASDCTSCEIDTSYPSGVYAVNKSGEYQPFTVVIATRYRLSGSPDTAWVGGPGIIVTGKKTKALTRTTTIVFPTRGRYEVELTRTTTDWDEVDQSKKDLQRHGRSAWSTLRSIRPEYPIAYNKPLALAACRIQATGQLNGMLDTLNADMASVCPDWDAATGTWIDRETNNPASLFRYVLTGPAITYPLTAQEVAALGDWHAFCVAKGLTYNRVHDYEASVLEVLSDIAAAGRASPHDTGTTWGVIIDRALSVVSAHISPRNSWGFSGERAYAVFPDAFRVSFLDETNAFAKAERIVPWPGHTGEIKVLEKLDLPGVTDPDMVWRETRRRQYELERRPDVYTVNQDFESLTVARGDRVQLSHDVLDRTQVAARVKTVAGDKVYLDEIVTFEEGRDYVCRFRRDDGSSLMRTVTGRGETQSLTLAGAGDMPDVGNLAFFGVSTRESLACTVKGVEAMENFTARLTLIDHAPEIEALVDAEVVPAWSGRAGAEAQTNTGTPLIPTITDVVSGRQAADSVSTENPYPVVALVAANGADTVPIATFQARGRIVGSGAWTTASAAVGAGTVLLPGFARGDSIEVQTQAISEAAVPSGWSASFAHVVAGTDASSPAGLTVAIERRNLNGSGVAAFLRLTCNPPPRTDLFLVGRYRPVGSTTWFVMDRDTANAYSLTSPPLSDATSYTVEGALSSSGGDDVSAYVAATGSPIAATADPVAPATPTYTSATLAAPNVNHAFTLPGSANVRSARLSRAFGAGKVFADAAAVASVAGGPNQSLTSADAIDLGLYQYWLEALNGSGVASPTAGPKTIYNLLPTTNLFTSPNDFTAAAWGKGAVTAVADQAASPDPAGGTIADAILETATTAQHFLRQVAAIASGAPTRFTLAVKANGRTELLYRVADSTETIYAQVIVDLAAGTVGAISVAGGAVLSGAAGFAGSGGITSLGGGWYLISLRATLGTATSAQGKVYLRNAANTYLGDTTKGIYVLAGALS